jgi:hypothetical protein
MGFEVGIVGSARDLEAFLRVPALLRPQSFVNKVPGRWVRPLLDRRRNPFFRHADHALVVARRDGRPVGRVALFVDHLCNRTHGEQVGTFALFDCIDSPRVAVQIFATADRWFSDHHVVRVRGPMGPAMRLGTGLLVEGHGHAPMPGTTFDPLELGPLIEAAGYAPWRDLDAYRLGTSGLPQLVSRAADAARRRRGLVLRTFDVDAFDSDISKVREVMNDTPGPGGACTPWTVDEVRWMAERLWHILDPPLVLLAEQDGVPAGMVLALRNVREVLHGRSPRSSVLDGLRITAALRLKRATSARILMLSVRPTYVGGEGDMTALLLGEILGRLALLGVAWTEVSPVDPGDGPLVDVLTAARAEAYKTYRMYEKVLGGS